MSQTGQGGETSGLRREISMKIKKKQLLSNQTFKDKSLRTQFVEPATMCMESSYWRNTTHHRQSTPTSFPEHQPDVARHHSLGHLAYNSSQPKFERFVFKIYSNNHDFNFFFQRATRLHRAFMARTTSQSRFYSLRHPTRFYRFRYAFSFVQVNFAPTHTHTQTITRFGFHFLF